MKKVLFAALLCTPAFLLASCGPSAEQAPDAPLPSTTAATSGKPDGQRLYVQNCAACHQAAQDAVGPALKGALGRWGGDKNRLYSFIRNNQDAIAKGDARAVEVKKKWGGNMPAFPQLTDADIEAILNYVDP